MGGQYRFDTTFAQRLGEQKARRTIELALHQHVHQMNNGSLHATPGQAIGGLKTQQAASDDHGLSSSIGGGDHLVHIIKIAEGDHAGQVRTRQRQAHGV